MHRQNIAHRDLKPENILIKGEHELKVADLGAAKVLSPAGMNTPYVVSRYYRAPELIMGTRSYDCSIDIWSAGCIMFELLARTPLCPAASEGLSILEHVQALGKPTPAEKAELQSLCERSMTRLLDYDQGGRGGHTLTETLQLAMNHYDEGDEVEKVADLIVRCLRWAPSRRIKASEALSHPFFI